MTRNIMLLFYFFHRRVHFFTHGFCKWTSRISWCQVRGLFSSPKSSSSESLLFWIKHAKFQPGSALLHISLLLLDCSNVEVKSPFFQGSYKIYKRIQICIHCIALKGLKIFQSAFFRNGDWKETMNHQLIVHYQSRGSAVTVNKGMYLYKLCMGPCRKLDSVCFRFAREIGIEIFDQLICFIW